jgi:hypothetical protein
MTTLPLDMREVAFMAALAECGCFVLLKGTLFSVGSVLSQKFYRNKGRGRDERYGPSPSFHIVDRLIASSAQR